MPTYRAEGVVLRTQRLGEADRIVTLLTRDHGKVRAVAKGVRRTSSKFGARLEPFMVVDAQLWQGRSLDTVTQAVMLASYGADISTDFEAFAAASTMAEAAERLSEADASPAQFVLLLGALRSLARGDRRPRLTLDSYLLRALALAGWAPTFEACAKCGAPGPHSRISVPTGGAVCDACVPPGSIAVRSEVMLHLSALLAGDWPAVEATSLDDADRAAGVVASYTQFHLERGLRSLDTLSREAHVGLANGRGVGSERKKNHRG